MLEQKLREELVEYGKKLLKEGLVQGTWGNISVKLDDNFMLVTPSGIDYERLTAADMVKVNISNLRYEGKTPPTSEKDLHAAIYKAREDVKAVVHTHAKYCCVFAVANKDMPIIDEFEDELNTIKVTDYAKAGSKKLAQNAVGALGDNVGALISNHGMVACGATLEDAFENCVKIEENGKKYLLTK